MKRRWFEFTQSDLWIGRELLCVSSNNHTYLCGDTYKIEARNASDPYEPTSYLIPGKSDLGFETWEVEELNLSITVDFIPMDLLDDREVFTYKISGNLPERFKEGVRQW